MEEKQLTVDELATLIAPYLNSKMLVTALGKGTIQTFKGISYGNRYKWWHVKYYELFSVKIEGRKAHHAREVPIDWCRLLLKPLTSVTERQWDKIGNELGINSGMRVYLMYDIMGQANPPSHFRWPVINKALMLLRKMSFDVDGLIEMGIAKNIYEYNKKARAAAKEGV